MGSNETLGLMVGDTEGATLGLVDGAYEIVGNEETVADIVGVSVGSTVGGCIGRNEGEFEGATVGGHVGTTVGSTVGQMAQL